MDKTTLDSLQVFREHRFRTPSRFEQEIGLWVDRIGLRGQRAIPPRLRQLGQYGLVFVETGSGAFECPRTGRLPVQAGQAIVLFPQQPSRYGPDEHWVEKSIVWSGPEAALLERLGYVDPTRMVIDDPTGAAPRAFAALQDLMGDQDLAAVLERKTILLQMLGELFRTARQEQHRRGVQRQMRHVVAYLERHFAEELPVDGIARHFHMSTTHFRRSFRAYTGSGPREFITALRMSRAKALLAGGMSIKETARQVGYDDVFYFMRVFKRAVGMTAGQFVERGV